MVQLDSFVKFDGFMEQILFQTFILSFTSLCAITYLKSMNAPDTSQYVMILKLWNLVLPLSKPTGWLFEF